MYKKTIIIFSEYFVIPVAGIFFFLSLQTNSFIEQVSILLIGGILLVISLLVSKILKKLINIPRPHSDLKFFEPHDQHAFPSGHATGLFSLTTFIFSMSNMFGLLALFFTLIVVIARVKAYVHYGRDIVAGSLLGVVVTLLFFTSITNLVHSYLTIVLPGF